MNLEEYKEWLEKNGNKEEKEAYRVVEKILEWHLKYRTSFKHIKIYPRFRYKGIEFDLLILLSDKDVEINELNKDGLFIYRIIAVEFKETDVRKVISQAITRKEYVHYTYIATRNVPLEYDQIFMLALFGIGWVVWESGFAKLILPAKYYETGDWKLKEMIDILLNEKFKEVVEDVVKERWKEWIKKRRKY
ncbi:MAG: hypothetical protein B6U78_03060 [Candidatus Aenigmarchaeota archaeon ex4484_224]|nr:MAG: hypothetical protein B6U78_03060 [Candidatus Aenigmarchaeota archaeon ex4484_224]